MLNIYYIVFTAILFSQVAKAWPPTYGAEFEVTRPGLKIFDPFKDIAEETNVKIAQLEFVNKIRERCLVSKCTVVEVEDSWDKDYIVKYRDGWWFKVSYDPGCIEFTFKPSTLEELEQRRNFINDQIFGTAAMVGLYPSLAKSGHFNIGAKSAFGNDGKKFLRFFIDYQNNDHLALGSLGKDLFNAPPISLLSNQQKKSLQNLVTRVNSGEITSIKDIVKIIQDEVYTKSYFDTGSSPFHYQAIGLKHIYETDLDKSDAPLELRAIRGQLNAESFNLLAEIFEARIKYLNKLSSQIIYTEKANPNYTATELNSRFAAYIEETGLDYERYKSLLPKNIQEAGFDSSIVSFNKKCSSIFSK